MWYVIQTLGGEEERTADIIRKRIPPRCLEECFIPKRERIKKFRGCWNRVEEVLFHGYVFVISNEPEKLYRELRRIPKLARLLGREGSEFMPLNKEEERLVSGIGDAKHKTVISAIEMGAGKEIRVIHGPLKDFAEDVVKVDLHKREAVVKAEFMGREMELKIGIEMISREERGQCQDGK